MSRLNLISRSAARIAPSARAAAWTLLLALQAALLPVTGLLTGPAAAADLNNDGSDGDEIALPSGFEGPRVQDGTVVFPTGSDTWSVVSYPYWWHAADTVYGVHNVAIAFATHADLVLKISYNALNGGGHVDLDFRINGVTVGSFVVTEAHGTGYIYRHFDFDPIAPPFELRYTETNLVDGGQGSISIDQTGLCSVILSNVDVATDPAHPGEDIVVTATVAGFAPSSGELLHRPGGAPGAFWGMPMSVDGGVLTGTIPAADVTARGIEYYVQINGTNVSVTMPPTAPTTPFFLPVEFASRRISPVPPAETYVLMGLPFEPTDGDPGAVLVDDLGSYDIRRWRFGRYDPAASAYAAFPATADFAPGRGFWLIMRDPVAVGAAGRSTNSVQGVSITVEPGWNEIAHPFLFPVDRTMVDFSAAPNVQQRFVGWVDGGYEDQDVLVPWSGYWVFNGGGASETIHVPGIESVGGVRKPAAGIATGGGFGIEVSVRQGDGYDRRNIAGVDDNAIEGLDALDRREPPALPGVVSAYFLREGSGSATHRLTADVLPPSEAGNTWTFVVDAPASEDPATLAFDGIETVPHEFEAILFDLDSGGELDLRSGERELRFPASIASRYYLAVGTAAYVDEVRDSRPLPFFALGSPAPTPSPGAVSMRFALPEPSYVRFRIYDAGGRLVRMLVDERLEAGPHVVTWAGVDGTGRPVASGVYFGQIEAGTHRATTRLLILR